jgi:hypothetical protein
VFNAVLQIAGDCLHGGHGRAGPQGAATLHARFLSLFPCTGPGPAAGAPDVAELALLLGVLAPHLNLRVFTVEELEVGDPAAPPAARHRGVHAP